LLDAGGVSKAAAEPPHSKGCWRIRWSSFYPSIRCKRISG
jgi:hypothetical protein